MKIGWWILSVFLVLIFLVVAFLYMSLAKTKVDFTNLNGSLINPSDSLSFDETKMQFDERFVYYLLMSVKAYYLHNAPLSSDEPRIEILVGNRTYSAVVKNTEILIAERGIADPDIRIVTDLDEAAKMVKYPGQVKESFANGKSSIELLASKTTLFSKGYLNLYTELTGKSITGSIVRIYTN